MDQFTHTVFEIRNKFLNDYCIEKINEEYSEFKKTNPKFFKMLISPDCDAYMLEKLIDCYKLKDTMEQEKIDEQFGTYAVRKFITKK